MPQKILAWIVPIDAGATPEHPIVVPPPEEPGEPPTIWPSPGHPAHPIQLPPGFPAHPIFQPPTVEHPIVIPPGFINEDPPVPAHPIVIPQPPGTDPPPMVSHPIVLPTPEHPIYIPTPGPGDPDSPILGNPHPSHPIYVPFPDADAHPEQPIVLPNPKGVVVLLEDYNGTPPPPDGVPNDHVPVVLWFGPGTVAMVVWIPPVATTKPGGKKS